MNLWVDLFHNRTSNSARNYSCSIWLTFLILDHIVHYYFYIKQIKYAKNVSIIMFEYFEYFDKLLPSNLRISRRQILFLNDKPTMVSHFNLRTSTTASSCNNYPTYNLQALDEVVRGSERGFQDKTTYNSCMSCANFPESLTK